MKINLERVRKWVSHKYYEAMWSDVPKWKRQTHVLRSHRGFVKPLLARLQRMLNK